MRIAVDLRCLAGEGHAKRGIGKYLINLLPMAFAAGREHTYILYTWRGNNLPASLTAFSNVEVRFIGNNFLRKADNFYFSRRIRHLPLTYYTRVREKVIFLPDIFYGVIPGKKVISVIYDIIPLLFQKEYFMSYANSDTGIFQPKARDRYQKSIEEFTKVDHILSISKASLEDLHRLVPRTKEIPATITPLAAQELPQPQKRRLIEGDYILYVGGNDYRKYVAELIGYFEIIKKEKSVKDLQLILVGNDFQPASKRFNMRFWDRYEKSSVKDSIVMMGYVEDRALAALYRDCSVFAFPSQYEGFGMPVLEAMQASAPVVAFANSSIVEIAGDAALLAKTEKEYIKLLESLITNKTMARKQIIKGRDQAKKFTWEKTAELSLQAISKLID